MVSFEVSRLCLFLRKILPVKLLIVDNHDSFTHNLEQIIRESGWRNYDICFPEDLDLSRLADYNKVLLSPGPGLPNERPVLKELVLRAGKNISVLGVCLGHQAIAEAFGGTLRHVGRVAHGEAVEMCHTNESLIFSEIPADFIGGKYHSWCVEEKTFPDVLKITACDPDGLIMALEHKELPVYGIQFHPESIMTPEGAKMIRNWLAADLDGRAEAG